MTQTLETITKKLQSTHPGLALDIDDTISLTSDGYFDLLRQEFPAPSYLTKELFRKHYAITGITLHWKDISNAYELLKTKVNDSQFHYELSPFPHAVHHTNTLHHHQLFSCYLTARKEDMRTLTQRWLDEHGFPKKPLIMRNNTIDYANQVKWKTSTLHALQPHITGLIDNDTRILSHLQQQKYPGRMYLFGLSEHEYNGNGSITVRETWPEMATVILNNYQKKC